MSPPRPERHAELMAHLVRAVREDPAALAPSIRRAVFEQSPAIPGEAADYVRRVFAESHRISDADIERLKATFNEEEIFEITIAAAVGAGHQRWEAARACLPTDQD